jgi:FkbM family methyltransferase
LALADMDGEMELTLNNKNQTMHSLIVGEQMKDDVHKVKGFDMSLTAKGYDTSERVKTMRFDTFMRENNIDEVDFVKFDVEGAEDMILRSEGFLNVAPKIKAIEVEFHFPNWKELVQHLISLGYQARRYDCSAIVLLFFR